MCDYSLFAVPNRLAREQEDLVAYRFPTGSMGLASPVDVRRNSEARQGSGSRGMWVSFKAFFSLPKAEPVSAVCIPPGARLRLEDIPPRVQQEYGVGSAEEVTFVQMSANVNSYRDAIRFANGRSLNLQELREGQRVKVLSLELAERMLDIPEEHHELLYRVR